MSKPHLLTNSNLIKALRRYAPVSTTDLALHLKVSVPTLHRALKQVQSEIFSTGGSKNTRYAARRSLRGSALPLPIYSVDHHGVGHYLTTMELVAPQGAFLNLKNMAWPVDVDHVSGWWGGLPYPIDDMQPQGFIGRNLARSLQHDLSVSSNPNDWSDDDIVFVLKQRGFDVTGNLILGDYAYEQWALQVAQPSMPCKQDHLESHYVAQAELAVAHGVAGSGAGGEFPKFTAMRELLGAKTPHVIVKFSGADGGAAVQRWSDLLVCEHLALHTLGHLTEIKVAATRVLQSHGRTFMESERFDRQEMFGRSALCSLSSINAAMIGLAENDWGKLVDQLYDMHLCHEAVLQQVQILWWYGRLIGNTDMHLGNLSFEVDHAHLKSPQFKLAPAYDMLPMMYAPLAGGEVVARNFVPTLPLPMVKDVWKNAAELAVQFWRIASEDSRISERFRHICQENANIIVAVLQRV